MARALTKERDGSVRWHRTIFHDGEWHTLFDAKLECEDGFRKECFAAG